MGKIIYVGQTIRSLKARIRSYAGSTKDRSKVSSIVNHLRKYDISNHQFEIIETVDLGILSEREIFWIKERGTLYPNGCNLTTGGESTKFSADSRKKMSQSHLGKIPWNKGKRCPEMGWNRGVKLPPMSLKAREKMKRVGQENHFFGKRHNENTLNKISAALIGRTAWNKKLQRIEAICPKTGTTVKTYEDRLQAKLDGFDTSCILRCIKNPKLKHHGYHWRENDNR